MFFFPGWGPVTDPKPGSHWLFAPGFAPHLQQPIACAQIEGTALRQDLDG